MAEFLTTHGTSFHLENIIKEAKASLVLISPYFQLSKTLFERLKDADKRSVKITIVYGKDELKENQKALLSQFTNLTVYFFENLHAKCFFNEDSMVITSMNIYEFSEKNNREMGVLITKESDSGLFEKAFQEAQSIQNSAQALRPFSAIRTNSFGQTKQFSNNSKDDGFCIRCGINKHYDLSRPLCLTCYEIWVQYQNQDYSEHYCHLCGKPTSTSFAKPLCDSCFYS